MKTILFTAAALVAAVPAFAADQIAFERDGVHFVATVRQQAGATVISGSEVETGKRFELRYLNGRVIGQYGVSDVRYQMPSTQAK